MSAKHEYEEITGWARQLVLKKVAILAAIPAIAGVGVTLGMPETWVAKIVAAAAVVFTLLGVLLGAVRAQKVVTPADPAMATVSSNGIPLVEAPTVIAPAVDPGDVPVLADEPPPA